MTSSLDRCGELSLVCGACACDPSGKDLAALRNKLAELSAVLVINCIIFTAENTNLLFSVEIALSSERGIALLGLIKSHDFLQSTNPTAAAAALPAAVDPRHEKGSSSSIPSGMFIKPSIAPEGSSLAGADAPPKPPAD